MSYRPHDEDLSSGTPVARHGAPVHGQAYLKTDAYLKTEACLKTEAYLVTLVADGVIGRLEDEVGVAGANLVKACWRGAWGMPG